MAIKAKSCIPVRLQGVPQISFVLGGVCLYY